MAKWQIEMNNPSQRTQIEAEGWNVKDGVIHFGNKGETARFICPLSQFVYAKQLPESKENP